MSLFLTTTGNATLIFCVKDMPLNLSPSELAQLASQDFKGKPNQIGLIYASNGALERVYFGKSDDLYALGRLPAALPAGVYELTGATTLDALAFAGNQYKFSRYKKDTSTARVLKVSQSVYDEAAVLLAGIVLARDLVNTPANDMTPAALESVSRETLLPHGAVIKVTKGEDLLTENFPLIYHVGKASSVAPRLIDVTWGRSDAPKVTIVGKGVCFDTGGLNIKPDSGMLLMKKDMGGAATALALAHMIMTLKLDVRLRLLIPAVENAIAGNAFRPSDIYPSRKGLTVEIGNTDAEGRLVLADALTLADDDAPDLLIDFATLTGAARVALGPDIPPFYTHDDGLASELQAISFKINDPVWRMPLWKAYDSSMDGKISDLSSTGSLPFAGSITAGHFLNRFVTKTKSYVHFDIFAHVPVASPGRTFGGELQAARACLALIQSKFC
jgi:leucyl aminopeptidase